MTDLALKKDDFVSDQEVRWCPGCGDYAILAAMQRTAPKLGIAKENFVFVSGIGCSSRFPYYMDTYGFHTIHGRPMAFATGLACTREDLSVWVITGDGDALSIGGNHFIHTLRRNVNLNVLCFNNKIYGLTKGQYSPTSEVGKRTKSTPYGSIDNPVSALTMALASEATFIARSVDVFTPHLSALIESAAAHKGISFVEIYQNCNIFNDGAHQHISERSSRDENVLYLEDGKPMIFGKDKDRGIRINANYELEVVKLGENGITEKDILVHDLKRGNPGITHMLTQMDHPEFPVPMGIFRQLERPTYDDALRSQVKDVVSQKGKGDLQKLLRGSQTWEVAK